ncbi:DNA repair protein XRCC4, putative isoform 1, partial [Capsicum annuum]
MCRFFNGLSLNNGGLVPNAAKSIKMEVGWSGFKPQRSLEVIIFTSEEPTRFGISCLGSRLLAGIVQLAEQLKSTKYSHNVSFSDADKSAGYANAKGDLSEVFLEKETYSAFVKLHIEQGVSIDVVTAIAAPASIKVTFEGNGGHAGAALMPKISIEFLVVRVQNHLCTGCSAELMYVLEPTKKVAAVKLIDDWLMILFLSFFTPSKLIENGIMICF